MNKVLYKTEVLLWYTERVLCTFCWTAFVWEVRRCWPFSWWARRTRTVQELEKSVIILCLRWTLRRWTGCIMSCIYAWLLPSKLVYLNSLVCYWDYKSQFPLGRGCTAVRSVCFPTLSTLGLALWTQRTGGVEFSADLILMTKTKCIGTVTESHSQSKRLNHHWNLFSAYAKFAAFKNNRSGPLQCTFSYLFLVPVLAGSGFFFMTVLLCSRPRCCLQRPKRWERCWEQQVASADSEFPCW